MTLATAITNLQAISTALTTVSIKAAPDTPIEGVPPLPASITYPVSGSATLNNAADVRLDVTVKTNLYFPRGNLPEAYTKITACCVEFLKQLAGDPTLGGAVTSILAPTFEVLFQDWNGQQVVTLSISIPLKIRETPA